MANQATERLPTPVDPDYLYEPYRSTLTRGPRKPLIVIPQTLSERTGPVFGHETVTESSSDLTRQHSGEPLGERIIVSGRILNEHGLPVSNALIEIWQANAAGRYFHKKDQHHAPLDPNFTGGGRAVTDSDGRYRFVSIKPGAYPWQNHENAWRPAHIHFSIFGLSFGTRLVTQMYFPGDPLLSYDPIFHSVREPSVRERLIAQFDLGLTRPEWALGYQFDIMLRGHRATPFED
ncbi:MAG TPA: protocatechuate 3,4-dioxygenase subunit beta [Bryobacteraceae bacterium]|nr:protocatechuate 3,4-dioxygenase subunit beta [Bryobacteraceae bacterium]